MLKFKSIIMKILSIFMIIVFSMITLVGTWQVITRYVFNNPSAWTEEILTYGFVWLSILSATYVFGIREHMRLTFFLDKLSFKMRKVLEIIIELIIILFSILVFVYGGIKICSLTFIQITPALQWSTGMLYSIIPISGVLTIIFSIINIIEIIKIDSEKDLKKEI